jgi:very-short-patch-repair endonuclease
LHREHVGVYALGHTAPSDLARWSAAVLACGECAGLSLRSCSVFWRIRAGEFPRVDVTVPGRGTRRRKGIRVHVSSFLEGEVVVANGIRVTTPARTVVDMAHELRDEDAIHGMLRQMQYRGLFDLAAIEISNRRRPSRILNAALDDLRPTDSPIEDAFKSKVLRRYKLAEPKFQKKVEGFRVDVFWPEARLIVELDGRNHVLPAMRQADAIRDNILQLAGYIVLRFTKADITRRHEHIARQILAAYTQRVTL